MTGTIASHAHDRTAAGVAAIGLWATLAVMTVATGRVPPFQLTAMAFVVATIVGFVWAGVTGQSLGVLKALPAGAWALGIYGLLGFHVFYFMALKSAPPLEASLVCYLWPLLIVVFSGLLPGADGGRLRAIHVLGAAIGFAGTALVMVQASGRPTFSGALTGYALAAAAAFVWASYSVGSRRYKDIPSVAVTGACAVTAVGTFVLHLLFENWVWPATASEWLAILGLGLGPTGLAFYLWDEGMKRGNVRLLGAASYATPLLSTLLMAALGFGQLTPAIAIAAVMVTTGAALAGQK